MDTGELIRRWRVDRELTQAEVAARLGVDQSFVSAYETGRRSPSVDVLARFADAVGGRLAVELDGRRPVDHDHALTIADLAMHLRATDQADHDGRMTLVLEFSRGHFEANPGTRHDLLVDRPDDVGGPWDALLGGLAEHFSFQDERDAPEWVYERHRFLERAWYFVDHPRLHALARFGAPAACARRLVFIDRHDLEHV